ncbi:hypothetical protein AX14_014017 [Amanita brunnescens Koide BX004]|nr:hypothetical protein AX14_014017 [Amanita brunnescens Koide BX004]
MAIMLNNEQAYTMNEGFPMEMDLCALLQNMKLHYPVDEKTTLGAPFTTEQPAMGVAGDVIIPDEMNYHSDEDSIQSSGSEASVDEDYGCAYLQSIRSRLELFITTGGGYIEAIFTHREICGAYPAGHVQCPRALSDIAYALERRAWRADREADGEAIAAFRHEAWFIANLINSIPPKSNGVSACMMHAW